MSEPVVAGVSATSGAWVTPRSRIAASAPAPAFQNRLVVERTPTVFGGERGALKRAGMDQAVRGENDYQ